jgi:hypothetical protein
VDLVPTIAGGDRSARQRHGALTARRRRREETFLHALAVRLDRAQVDMCQVGLAVEEGVEPSGERG